MLTRSMGALLFPPLLHYHIVPSHCNIERLTCGINCAVERKGAVSQRSEVSDNPVRDQENSVFESSGPHGGEYEDLMMEAASTSETSVNFHQTARRNNPEDSQHQIAYLFRMYQ
jgi:hypothetical protein